MINPWEWMHHYCSGSVAIQVLLSMSACQLKSSQKEFDSPVLCCSETWNSIACYPEISGIRIDGWPPQQGIYENLDGGFPLVIFNQDMDTAVVLSPATTFMSSASNSFQDDQTSETTLTFGPMSSINEVNKCSLSLRYFTANRYTMS